MDPLSLKTRACKWNSHHSADPKSILKINSGKPKEEITRLHSSRMRTGRLLSVSPSMFCSRGRGACLGGVPPPGWWGCQDSGGGVPAPEGVPAPGGAWS